MHWGRLNKLKRLPIFAVLFTYIFVASGIISSLLCLFLLVLWPISKNAYRKITSQLAYSVFGQFVWVSVDWADIKVVMFAKDEVLQHCGREHAMWTLSHRGDLDWIVGYIFGCRFNFLHNIKTLPKNSVFYVPGFGQLLWATECVFLSRSYAKDEKNILKQCTLYKESSMPIQVCIFPEGTRFTMAKYAKGVEFARERGLKEFKHHLFPRTKGFALLAQSLKNRAEFKALYDAGFAYPKCKRLPTAFDILLGRPVEVYFYARRIPMEEVPSSKDDLTDFCVKLFQHKDEAYEYYLQHGAFPAPRHPCSPSMGKLRLMVLGWWVLLLSPVVWLFYYMGLQSVILILMGSLLVSVLMVAMVRYSHAEVGSAPEKSKTT